MWIRRAGCRLAAAIAAWFLSLSVLGKIAVSVFALHGLLLAALAIHHLASSKRPKPSHPLTVRVHRPAPPRQSSAAPQKSSSPARKATPQSAKKKQAAPVKQQPAQTIDSSLLREIEQAFASLETVAKETRSANSFSLPRYLESNLEASVEEMSGSSPAASYGPTLARILQQRLQLPERGEVRIRLDLEPPGKIRTLEILDSKSAKNAQWLKNQLPLLDLPCFNDFGICLERIEFTVTFRNVEKN